MTTDTEAKKKADAVAPASTLNPNNDPIDQNKDAGAKQPVAQVTEAGNIPSPPDDAPVEPNSGSDKAVPPASAQAGEAAQAGETSTSSGTAPKGSPDIAISSVTASAASESSTAVQPAFSLKIVNGRVLVSQIRPHEENGKIYSDKESIEDLIRSIKAIGILDALVITKDGRIISGHRRYRTALKLMITEVPVRVFESDDELEIKRALLEHNRQRIKSKTQIAAEASLRMQIEREFAARRKAAAGSGVVETLPPAKKGKARDLAGKAMGISGRSADKAAKAHEASTALRAQGKTEDADEIDAALNKNGYDAGYQKAVEKGAIKKSATKGTAAAKKSGGTPAAMKKSTSSAKTASEPTVKASTASPKAIDGDAALETAEVVLTFLRSPAAETMTETEKDNWKKLLEQIDECRATLDL